MGTKCSGANEKYIIAFVEQIVCFILICDTRFHKVSRALGFASPKLSDMNL